MAQTLYATLADIQDLGLRSINDRIDKGLITADQVDKALATASSEAEGYLSTRYTPPFTSWPDSLRSHVARIAAFLLLTRTGYAPGAEGNELIMSGHDMAISWLEKVASGRVTLPLNTTSQRPLNVPQVYSEAERGWPRA